MSGQVRIRSSLAAMLLPLALPIVALSVGMRSPPAALATLAQDLQFWPVAGFAGFTAWLVLLRPMRWSRAAAAPATPTETPREVAANPAPAPAPDAPRAPTAAPASPAQGADLADRARFVALTLAFPEVGPARPGAARPALDSWPLQITCQPTRFTLTPRHAALGYRLEFCNRGAETLGPLIIRGDLRADANPGAENRRTAPDNVVAGDDHMLPPCHYLDNLAPGKSIQLSGELRLPLAGIAVTRLGSAELLAPMVRFYADSTVNSRPALNIAACFAIGLPPLAVGGRIQPFRLDLGPGSWRRLFARRLLSADHL